MLLAVLIVRLVGLWLFLANAAALLQLQRIKTHVGGMTVSSPFPGDIILVTAGAALLGLALVIFAVPVVRLLTFDVDAADRGSDFNDRLLRR